MSNVKFGTKEWSDISKNISKGCEHGCLYCYARDMALQHGRISKAEEWENMEVNEASLSSLPRQKGVVMFPTTHDITPSILEQSLLVLTRLLNAGRQVLLVSKAHLSCIDRITKELSVYKTQLEIRITIGSDDNTILGYWEPGAPRFEERLAALKLAYLRNFKTSVSCEPMLDTANTERLVSKVAIYCSGDIWLGKLNSLRRRCNLASEEAKRKIELGQTDEKIEMIYRSLKDNPQIKWKESIVSVIGGINERKKTKTYEPKAFIGQSWQAQAARK